MSETSTERSALRSRPSQDDHSHGSSWSRPGSFAMIGVVYIVAIGAAIGACFGFNRDGGRDPVFVGAVAAAVSTGVIYCFSVALGNTSCFDIYWSVLPPALAIYWPLAADASDRKIPPARTVLLVVAIFIWALRLTYNWAVGWPGLQHEDWRYTQIRHDITRGSNSLGARILYWAVGSLIALHGIPAAEVYVGTLPVYVALYRGERGIVASDGVGFVVCILAVALEWRADYEMRRWRENTNDKDATIDEGLWRYSRHPNYLGEALFWWGLYIFGLGADSAYKWWWTGVGALIITIMFFGASIPMMEKRQMEKRPAAYAAYKRRVPSPLFFWFRRNE